MKDSSGLLEYQNIETCVDTLLYLINQENDIPKQDISYLEASLKKVVSSSFEIVFVGAFSAGKSMLINAVLGKELLYSSEGHTTSTECRIQYAEIGAEKVVLTFMSRRKIQARMNALCEILEIKPVSNISQGNEVENLLKQCREIIDKEPGKSHSESARQAQSLVFLIQGFKKNQGNIHQDTPTPYSMEQLKLSNLESAAEYARYGSNAAVLEKIEYYLNHSLLEDGNILVDTPGIDAPVAQDAKITYDKIEEDPDTSAIICVLKAASTGDPTIEEMDLLEKLRSNPSIRDRVFYVFNRIDDTWDNNELSDRLKNLINSDFRVACEEGRLFKTSALLSFYGSRVKNNNNRDKSWGLRDIFSISNEDLDKEEKTPQFVYEFNKYCLSSPKLKGSGLNPFDGDKNLANLSSNQKYLAILGLLEIPILDKLLQDSGIEDQGEKIGFNSTITRYLEDEKRPQLFKDLVNDLKPISTSLRNFYTSKFHDLGNQSQRIEEIESAQLNQIFQQLQDISDSISMDIEQVVSQVIAGEDSNFEDSFQRLKSSIIKKLDELLSNLSVQQLYKSATLVRDNSTAPFLGVLVEAFYFLSSSIEIVFVKEAKEVINSFFESLLNRVRKSDSYLALNELIGHDAGIIQDILQKKNDTINDVEREINVICDRYIRESLSFYDAFLAAEAKRAFSGLFFSFIEKVFRTDALADAFLNLFIEGSTPDPEAARRLLNEVKQIVLNEVDAQRDPFLKEKLPLYDQETFSIGHIRQILKQHSQKSNHEGLTGTEDGIRQLLKLDFEPKVYETIELTFRQSVNQRLKKHLSVELSRTLRNSIVDQYEHARKRLEGIAKENASEYLAKRGQLKLEIQGRVNEYNQAIGGINQCLRVQKLDTHCLPTINLSS